MFCEKCGAQMEEDTLFCPECGAKVEKEEAAGTEAAGKEVVYCPNCGFENEAGALFCLSCGTSLSDEEQPGAGSAAGGASGKGKTMLFAGLGAAVVLIAIIVVGIKLFGGRGGSKAEALVYLKDNEVVSFSKETKTTFGEDVYKDKSEISGPQSGGAGVVLSEDGKYIFYPKNYKAGKYDLYYGEMKNNGAKGEKLASDVTAYTVLESGKVIWLNDDEKLSIADFADLTKAEKIGSSVGEYWVAEDESQILWLTSGEGKLYTRPAQIGGEYEKRDSDVTKIVYASDDFNHIVYQKEEGMYCLNDLADKQKVTSDEIIDYAVIGSGEETVIYYSVEDDEEVTWSDFFEDDLKKKAKDEKQATAQELSRELVDEVISEMFDKTSVLYSYVPGDTGAEKCAEIGILGDMPFWGNENAPAFLYPYIDLDHIEKGKLSDIEEVINELMESDFGKEAEKRLKEKVVNILVEIFDNMAEGMELRLISGDGEITLDYDAEEYGILCAGLGASESTKEYYLVAISNEFWETALEAALGEAVGSEDYSDEEDYDYDESGYYDDEYRFYDEEEEPAASVEDDTEDDADAFEDISVALFKTNYGASDGEPDGELELLSDEVYTSSWLVTDKGVYYVTEVSSGKGELYYNGERIDSDVDPWSIKELENKKGVLYLTDPSDKKAEGTLKIYVDGETKKIADDVAYYCSNEKGEVAFLANYNFEKHRGDLKRYKDGEIVSIDSDVANVLLFN